MSNLKTAETEDWLKSVLEEKAYKEITEEYVNSARFLKEKGSTIIDKVANSDGTLNIDKWTALVGSSFIDDHTKAFLNQGKNLNLGGVSGYLSTQATSSHIEKFRWH